MNIKKLARYFAGFLPSSRPVNMSDFVDVLRNNLNISDDYLEKFSHLSGAILGNFEDLFLEILKSEEGERKIRSILSLYRLPSGFLDLGFYEPQVHKEDVLFRTFKNEEDFRDNFLPGFFTRLGFQDVRITHGSNEKGKDLIMKRLNEFGEYEYIAAQVKFGDIGATASKDDNITTIITQIQQAFQNPYKNPDTNLEHLISKILIVTNGKITDSAISEIMNIDPKYYKNTIVFIDGTRIKNLLMKISS